MPPCLTLSIITYISRVKWDNPGKGIAPSPIPWCSSYWKGSPKVTLNYSRQLYFTYNLHTGCSIWSIDSTLSGVTTPGQSGPGSNGNEGVLHIPQISKAGVLPSDGLMSYPIHSLQAGLTLLQRSSQYILQPQLTGLTRWLKNLCRNMILGIIFLYYSLYINTEISWDWYLGQVPNIFISRLFCINSYIVIYSNLLINDYVLGDCLFCEW